MFDVSAFPFYYPTAQRKSNGDNLFVLIKYQLTRPLRYALEIALTLDFDNEKIDLLINDAKKGGLTLTKGGQQIKRDTRPCRCRQRGAWAPHAERAKEKKAAKQTIKNEFWMTRCISRKYF